MLPRVVILLSLGKERIGLVGLGLVILPLGHSLLDLLIALGQVPAHTGPTTSPRLRRASTTAKRAFRIWIHPLSLSEIGFTGSPYMASTGDHTKLFLRSNMILGRLHPVVPLEFQIDPVDPLPQDLGDVARLRIRSLQDLR